jgi:sugar/nucleoside kinase (ribokinase family)
MKKVFICGGASYNSVITLDEFPEPVSQTIHQCPFNETIGNTGADKVLNLCKLDFDITFHTVIGQDTFGEKVLSYLNHPNINVITDIEPNGTERHVNIMNSKGERISIFINPNSENININYSKFEKYIATSDFTVINISDYCRHIIPVCKKLKKEIWTDLHDYDGKNRYHQDFIEASDYIFMSSEKYKDYKTFMKKQIEAGKKLVVCTHGENGATALCQKEGWIDVKAINSFKIVNTNGAGDAFFSGFLYGYSKGFDIL